MVEDLWNLKKPVDVKMYTILDSTPEWFDDGQFSFSDLGQTLLYIDKEHGAIRFSLKDGAVTKGE
ncbi:MAG TPA: hypothetical protein VIX42_12220 [Edaphobacter sp.]